MGTYDNATAIIKALNDNRSKLSALYSLYNSSLMVAEENRQLVGTYYEQMLDLKNDANLISAEVESSKNKKSALSLNKMKLKKIGADIKQINLDFEDNKNKYKIALKDCDALKIEYKHEVSELCKQFKSLVESGTELEPIIIKGYKQQIKIVKAIFDKIEQLISNYNIKKNQLDLDSDKFRVLAETANSLLSRMETTA